MSASTSVMLLGRKVGMTRVFTEKGESFPVTVLSLGPCVVTQVKTDETDGYSAVQIGYDEVKAKNSTFPLIAHDAKARTTPKRFHREFKVEPKATGSYTLGQTIDVSALDGSTFVDVIGQSKGKGFAGVMKRHHFKGLVNSHGTERKHRSPGSIGSYCSNRGFGGGLVKGKKMPGQMGDERVTARSIQVVSVDKDQNLMLVKGPVPGANGGMVMVRTAVRLNRKKAGMALVAAKK